MNAATTATDASTTNKRRKSSIFERHPKATLGFIWVLSLILFFGLTEVMLRHFSGLGQPVLFYKNSSFGYRLKPNQDTTRFGGATFRVNNLGLRANMDWDSSIKDKILFLGDSVTYGGNHISNEYLFSEVAVERLPNFHSGNAGIPNWGVENVYGLIVEENFLPASIYVTTFIENDFYRGLTSGENKPWIKYEKPHFALQELADFLWHRWIRNPRKKNRLAQQKQGQPTERVQRAVIKLKKIDAFLESKGYCHLILISPTQLQVSNEREKDLLVKSLLDQHGVEVVYILDNIRLTTAPNDEKQSWYQDNVHLTAAGHRVWGEVIYEELRKVSHTSCQDHFSLSR